MNGCPDIHVVGAAISAAPLAFGLSDQALLSSGFLKSKTVRASPTRAGEPADGIPFGVSDRTLLSSGFLKNVRF